MKSFVAASIVGLAAAESANPIRKVVDLLQKMQKKTEEEGAREEKLYKKFECYCKSNGEASAKKIAENAEKSAELESKIKEDSSTAKAAEEAYKQAKAERAETKQKLADGDKKRLASKNAFDAQHRDDEQNIAALASAINTLGQKDGESLLQAENKHDFARLRKIVLVSTSLSGFEKQSVNSFLMNTAEQGYSAGTGEIIGMLKQIKEEFSSTNAQRIAEEAEDAKSYAEIRSAQTGLIASLSSSIEKNQEKAGRFAVSASEAKTELVQVQNGYADALEWQKNNKAACADKSEEFALRQKIRGEEQAALTDAIKMLNSDDSLDLFNKALPAARSFLQKKTKHNQIQRAARNLRKQLDPRVSLVSTLVKNSEKYISSNSVDRPKFAMVIEMVDKLVITLKNEQVIDEKERENCISTRNVQEAEKKETSNRLKNIEASANDAASQIQSLEDDIATLKVSVAASDKLAAEATEQRKGENAEFIETSQTRNESAKLLKKVINRLQKFYNPDLHKEDKKSAAPASDENVGLLLQRRARVGYSLLQTSSKTETKAAVVALSTEAQAPATWEGEYKSQGGNPAVAAIQKFVDDLKIEGKEAEMDEATAQRDYEKLMADVSDSRKSETKQITQKDMQLAQQHASAEELAEESDNKKQQLFEIDSALHALNQNCDFIERNFELRRSNRENEIESLGNAKSALRGAQMFVQTSSKTQASDPQTLSVAPFGKEDTAHELTDAAAKTQSTLVDAVENAQVAEIKRTVFRSLTRLRAATIKEFDTIARLETQAIDAYNDAHHFQGENPIQPLHATEPGVETDKLRSLHE